MKMEIWNGIYYKYNSEWDYIWFDEKRDTQFETYTDEHRKEYVIADNSLNEDIYERGIETNVGDLMYGATKEAKGLLDLAEAEETFAQAGEKCVQNAIITTVQYIYKFGCEVGIYW